MFSVHRIKMFAVGWISYQNAEWGILPFGSFYGEVERPQFDTCLFRRFVAYYVDNSKSKSQCLRFLLYTAIRFFYVCGLGSLVQFLGI